MSANRWSEQRANDWYARQPWLVGCNFTPSTAINQLEMWQADTFDPETIARELSWAADIGFNSVRVFLHDLAWQADAEGFKQRMDQFLSIAWELGIHTMFVIFDDCWFPPVAGRQPEPIPGVHNSGWAQSPGFSVIRDRRQWTRLEAYVKDIIGSFGKDERVCVWDLYNEPGNAFLPLATEVGYKALPMAINRAVRQLLLPSATLALLKQTYGWAQSAKPMQPLTTPWWIPNLWLNRFQLAASDVISFHQYESAERLEKKINELQHAHRRPVLCTEFLGRELGSNFDTHLPIFKEHNVACYCWGLVSGKTQTIHNWSDKPGSPEPKLWHHDVFRADGTPYNQAEVEIIRRLTRS